MEQIHHLAEQKTVILISHRLANVTAADRIYVLDQGNVVENGTHRELLTATGRYEALWNAQQSWKITERKVHWHEKTKQSLHNAAAGRIGKAAHRIYHSGHSYGNSGPSLRCIYAIFGGCAVLDQLGLDVPFSTKIVFICVIVFALLRGILRYAEQACNHFIAFKLLALIRDKVFFALRRLCPAKLEGGTRET